MELEPVLIALLPLPERVVDDVLVGRGEPQLPPFPTIAFPLNAFVVFPSKAHMRPPITCSMKIMSSQVLLRCPRDV